jgi:hypothetical protein
MCRRKPGLLADPCRNGHRSIGFSFFFLKLCLLVVAAINFVHQAWGPSGSIWGCWTSWGNPRENLAQLGLVRW